MTPAAAPLPLRPASSRQGTLPVSPRDAPQTPIFSAVKKKDKNNPDSVVGSIGEDMLLSFFISSTNIYHPDRLPRVGIWQSMWPQGSSRSKRTRLSLCVLTRTRVHSNLPQLPRARTLQACARTPGQRGPLTQEPRGAGTRKVR